MNHTFKLIVGLGNPGSEYADTRHNAGFRLLDALAARAQASPWKNDRKFHGQTAKLQTADGEIWLLKPDTYMNRSGQSVQPLVSFYKIPLAEVLVIHDELDLPPGRIRFKRGGGNGGHNGLKDIQARLGSADFYRLRLGIGHPGDRNEVAAYVLNKPAPSDRTALEAALDHCIEHCQTLLNGDTAQLQRVLHGFKPTA